MTEEGLWDVRVGESPCCLGSGGWGATYREAALIGGVSKGTVDSLVGEHGMVTLLHLRR